MSKHRTIRPLTSGKQTKKGTFRRILHYLRGSRALLLFTLLFAAISVAATLYVPVLVGDAIDCILESGVNFPLLGEKILLILVSVGVTALSEWAMRAVNNRVTYRTVQRIREDAFDKIQRLPFSTIDTTPYGDVSSRVTVDVEVFADGLLVGFTQLFTGVFTILGTIGIMFVLNWVIAIAVTLLTPLSLFVARFISRKSYTYFAAQSLTRGEQTAFLDEMIGNLKVVKAFSREKKNEETFEVINEKLRGESLKATFFSSLTNPSTRFVNALVYALVAFLGGYFALKSGGENFALGKITFSAFTVGGIAKFLSYATQYTKPFNEISGVVTEFQNALACGERIFALIDLPAEESEEGKPSLLPVQGEVSFEKVSFSYEEDAPLIEDFSFTAKAGERVAIVGPTGCGKTTLINLLMRFYDPKKGAILVDEKEIKKFNKKSLRQNYGMVLQETWLKKGTVLENITMGKPNATREEVIAAAKASHAHSFIMRLPNGYDTLIGEEGGSLSQGQKQLLCITRIMLAPPPMLILDEATSSIDTRTEAKIQDDFASLMKGRTSFIVAHRLSTIREADVILVMKEGKIVEKGTHEELLAQNGFYKELYFSQFANE